MAVPTRDEFSAFLTLAEAPIQASTELPENVTEQDATNFLIDVERCWEHRANELANTAVWVWLAGQREFQRAVRLAFRQPRKIHLLLRSDRQHLSIEDRAKARVRRILQSNALDGSELRSVWSVRNQLESAQHGRFTRSWMFRCIHALTEYYDGSGGRELPELAREIEKAHREASEAVQRYRALAERLNAFQIRGVHAPGGFREFLGTPDLFGMPLQRRERFGCERLFVYRMFKANRDLWPTGPSRADAIAELMDLEGFRHQYDTRTIEKLCAGFHKLYRQLDARNRHLFAGAASLPESGERGRGA